MSALATEITTVTLPTAPLVAAVKHALLAIGRSKNQSVMAHLRVSAQFGCLQVSGFDYETSINRTVAAEGVLPTTLVPGAALKNALVRLDQKQDVILSVDLDRMVITQGTRSVTLATGPLDEYPRLPVAPSNSVLETTGGNLAAMTNALVPFVGKDEMLPVLTGIHFKLEGNTLVGEVTDRFRAAYMHNLVLSHDEALDVIVPHMSHVATVMGKDPAVTVSVENGIIFFSSETATIGQRLLEGEFPKMRSLFPSEPSTIASLDPTAMLGALKFVEVGVARNQAITVQVEENKVALVATGDDGSQHTDTVPATVSGEVNAIGFDPKFLGDAVKVWGKTHEVRMALTGPTRPALFEADSIPTLRVLLMPRRLVS